MNLEPFDNFNPDDPDYLLSVYLHAEAVEIKRQDREFCQAIAEIRQEEAEANGRRPGMDRIVTTRDREIDDNFLGALGELAVCKYLGLFPEIDGNFDTSRRDLFGILEVRARRGHHRDLLIKHSEDLKKGGTRTPWALVTFSEKKPYKTALFHGWINLADALALGQQVIIPGRGPRILVRSNQLRSPRELPGIIPTASLPVFLQSRRFES